jgi:hypothetical protein
VQEYRQVEVMADDNTVWLAQAQMAELFQSSKPSRKYRVDANCRVA